MEREADITSLGFLSLGDLVLNEIVGYFGLFFSFFLFFLKQLHDLNFLRVLSLAVGLESNFKRGEEFVP